MGEAAIMTTTELEVARVAAQAGGDVVSRYFREGVDVRQKGSWNLVSDADVESERAIVDVIRQAFPDHAVLGEESHRGDVDAEHLWVVDPLDGTNNFAHQVAHFAISIAYHHNGRPECGVVYNPMRGDWFVAARGRGALHNDQPACVSSSPGLDEVLVGVGFYYDRDATMRATLAAIGAVFQHGIHGIRRFGTASLDLCMVGIGAFGAFFEFELSAWDFAAGRLFVEEAGGRVTNCRGDELPLRKTTVLATNGHLHDAMLRVLEPHVPDQAP
ncbi:MAG: inositol monophosphatase family protein [Planctomycetota bacterium]|jgi:myo-inositol-1(or 4)-monophosphatase